LPSTIRMTCHISRIRTRKNRISKINVTGFGTCSGPSFTHPPSGEPTSIALSTGNGHPDRCSPERQTPLGQGAYFGSSQRVWQSAGLTYFCDAVVRPIASKMMTAFEKNEPIGFISTTFSTPRDPRDYRESSRKNWPVTIAVAIDAGLHPKKQLLSIVRAAAYFTV
jgi:hypothetical protein